MNKRIFGQAGDRPNVTNVAIILTDGKSNKDEHLTARYAEEARKNGRSCVYVFT